MKIIIFLIVLSFTSSAQLADHFNLYYQQMGDSNDVTTSSTRGQINHIFALGDSSLLTTGFVFSQTTLQDDELLGADESRSLQTFVPNFTLMHSLDRKHNLIFILRPGFYGDGEGDMNDDFRMEGGAIMTKVFSQKLTMGLGLARGTNFGRDLIVPLFQFLYTHSDTVYLTGVLPVRATLWYIYSSKLQLGLNYRLEGSLYNIDDTEIAGAEQLGFAAAHIGGVAKYNVFANHFINAELGITALRRYEWKNSKGTSTNIGQEPFEERELDNVPYLRLGWQKTF